MVESSDRELEAILKLIKLTQEGIVKWDVVQRTGDLIETDSIKYTNVMRCIYEGKHLRIYNEKRLKNKPDRIEKLMTESIFHGEATYPHWAERAVLELSNSQGQSLWRFEYKPAINDLLNAAKYQTSGVKDFLDSILSK